MNGIGFEILVRTPVPQLPPQVTTPPPPPHTHTHTHTHEACIKDKCQFSNLVLYVSNRHDFRFVFMHLNELVKRNDLLKN